MPLNCDLTSALQWIADAYTNVRKHVDPNSGYYPYPREAHHVAAIASSLSACGYSPVLEADYWWAYDQGEAVLSKPRADMWCPGGSAGTDLTVEVKLAGLWDDRSTIGGVPMQTAVASWASDVWRLAALGHPGDDNVERQYCFILSCMGSTLTPVASADSTKPGPAPSADALRQRLLDSPHGRNTASENVGEFFRIAAVELPGASVAWVPGPNLGVASLGMAVLTWKQTCFWEAKQARTWAGAPRK